MKKFSFLISVMVVVMMLASFSVQASGSISVTPDIFTGELNVSVSFSNCSNIPVSLEVIPDGVDEDELRVSGDALNSLLQTNDKIAHLEVSQADSKGRVSFSFPLAKPGKYTIRAHAMYNIGEAVTKEIDYIALSDAQYVWDNVVSDPAQYLPELLELLYIDDEELSEASDDEELHSVIRSYESIGDFTRENVNLFISKVKSDYRDIEFLRSVLSEINNADNTSEISLIVKDSVKADALGVTEYMARYNALKNTKIADKAVLGKSYASASDFAADFAAGITAAEEAQEENAPSHNPPKSPSKNSTGGSSLGTSVNIPHVLQNAYPFEDISDVSWATEAITELYNSGIINGKSQDKFAPNDNITREEFVKIALGVMGAEPVSGTPSFSDVDSSAWYAPYVNAAVSNGIVSGYSYAVFGIGDNITRQDVAVILDRVYKTSAVNNTVAFSDSNDISDYAKSAVERLSAAGVINGSDGRFMPRSNCTRAEAACMVYRIMSLMKEGK